MIQSKLAEKWGFSQQYISKLVAAGMPLETEAAAAAWLCENVKHFDAGARAEQIANLAARGPRKQGATLGNITPSNVSPQASDQAEVQDCTQQMLTIIEEAASILHAKNYSTDAKALELVRDIKRAAAELAKMKRIEIAPFGV